MPCFGGGFTFGSHFLQLLYFVLLQCTSPSRAFTPMGGLSGGTESSALPYLLQQVVDDAAIIFLFRRRSHPFAARFGSFACQLLLLLLLPLTLLLFQNETLFIFLYEQDNIQLGTPLQPLGVENTHTGALPGCVTISTIVT